MFYLLVRLTNVCSPSEANFFSLGVANREHNFSPPNRRPKSPLLRRKDRQVHLAEAIEAVERERAKERQREGARQVGLANRKSPGQNASENFSEASDQPKPEDRKANVIAARAVGPLWPSRSAKTP